MQRLIDEIEEQLSINNLDVIRSNFKHILDNGYDKSVLNGYVKKEIQQILETQTLERTKYYIARLKKGLSEIRTSKINDINLNRWKEYDDIITDSLWILDKRDNSGAHNAGYWGNFVPQIPNQLIRRYTKENEWIVDPFLGSGTTLIECKRLNRNGIGIELQPSVIELANQNILSDGNIFTAENSNRLEMYNGDSISTNYEVLFEKYRIKSAQLAILHPPYWDIIKFSDNKKDLSNAPTLQDFLNQINELTENISKVLDKDRYLALVISDKYVGGEWIPLAHYAMQEVMRVGFTLKSTIVKNFEETKGKINQKELWRYRALVGGFYIFKHEYIFIFKKK